MPDQRNFSAARSVDNDTVGVRLMNLCLASLVLGSLEFADSIVERFP